MPGSADRYRLAATVYDLAATAWSGGAIWRTRARTLAALRPDDRLLVPGPGTGRTVVEAALRGAEVTAVERSDAMRARLERRLRGRLDAEGRARVHVLAGTFEDIDPTARYDVVAAEHFLNVFDARTMPAVRERLIRHVRPGGLLVVADFSPLAGGLAVRALQRLHHAIPLGGCARLTGNARHAIYDHGVELAGHPLLAGVEWRGERSFGIGPRWFCAWTFRRNDRE